MLKYLQYTCVLAVSALTLCAQTTGPVPTVRTFGMIGLGSNQTARLNLLNPGVAASAAGNTCTVGVAYVDSNGMVLKTAALSIAPGKSAAFDLRSETDVTIASNDRKEIRATFATTFPPAAASNPTASANSCALFPTLEIFDNASGRTLVTLGHTEVVPSAIL